MSKSDVKRLSQLADDYRDRASHNPTENWSDLLKAHTLYNACALRDPGSKRWIIEAHRTQCLYWGQKVETSFEKQQEITQNLKTQIETIRFGNRKSLETVTKLFDSWDCAVENLDSKRSKIVNNVFVDKMRRVSGSCTADIRDFTNTIIQQSIKLCKQPQPCKFAAVAMGSLARGETTPYSDLEFLFLVEEKTSNNIEYFRLLAMTIYFLIGNLQETKLKYMNIEELKGFDDKGKNGFKIDGLQSKAGNIPTGNGRPEQKDKFILTVSELITEYTKVWNNPDPEESMKGDFTAMLGHTALLYGDTDLLQQFESAKHGVTANIARRNANHNMIQQDIQDYDFLPLETLQTVFHRVDLKSAIYRYPSILIFNLKLTYNITSRDSWETLRNLHDMGILSDSFYESLQLLLASAQYIRLAAYLYHDSQNENISFLQSSQSLGSPSEDGKDGLWHIPHPLLYHMSLHMIPVKQLITANNHDHDGLLRSLGSTLKFDKEFTAIKLNASLENYSEAIRIFEDLWLPRNQTSSTDVLMKLTQCYVYFIITNCYLQTRSFSKACQYFTLFAALCKSTNIQKEKELVYLHELVNMPMEEMSADDPHLAYVADAIQCPPIPNDHPYAPWIYMNRARSYSYVHKLKLSEQYLKMSWRAWELSEQSTCSEQEQLEFQAKFFCTQHSFFQQKREYSKALDAAKTSLELYKKMYGSESLQHNIGYCYNSVANAYYQLKNMSKAKEYYRLAMEIVEPLGHWNPMLYFNIGHTQVQLCEYEDAEKSFRKAQHILVSQPDINYSNLGDIKTEIGMLLKSRGNHDEAFRYFQAGYDVYDIADHLYYAGKCWNEIREYIHMKSIYMYTTNIYPCLCWLYQAPNQEDEDIEKLHSECERICKHIKISNECAMRDQAHFWELALVSLTLRMIKKWAVRNMKILRVINPDDPMPVYELELCRGISFYL